MTLEELKKMTKAELLDLAKQNGLKVTIQMMKAELIDVIAAAEKKKKKTPIPSKPAAKSDRKGLTPDEKRVEAARKVAKRFIAGVREQPRKAKKSKPEKETRPEAPRPPVARPAAAPPPPAARPTATPPTPVNPPKAARPVAQTPPPAAPPVTAARPPVDPPKAAKAKRPPKAAKKGPAPRKSVEAPKRVSDEAIRQAAEEGKYYLGAEQRVMPPIEATEIPKGYNVDRIAAMVRDPYWIFTYWEVTDRKYRELERAFAEAWPKCKMVLRVYDRTNDRESHFDIVLTREARTWYINVSAERRYQIAIGALSPDGRFELVAISNVVETPSGKISDRIDDKWLVPDDVFDRIFAASGGYDMHSASGELKGLLEKRLLEEISSGAVSSFGSGALYKESKGRAFRLWVATELILYGGTEPDAHVAVQGKEVKLRPDGTFSLRFALPDGKIDLPVTAVSADGLEERTIETDVTKKSHKKAPVLK
ncbi:MAG: DUF4912 domain-containing protein [Candidatus Krumholzibacteriaceae bacterium]|jgi:hypothetical protein